MGICALPDMYTHLPLGCNGITIKYTYCILSYISNSVEYLVVVNKEYSNNFELPYCNIPSVISYFSIVGCRLSKPG